MTEMSQISDVRSLPNVICSISVICLSVACSLLVWRKRKQYAMIVA
jgi:hypothetical protein